MRLIFAAFAIVIGLNGAPAAHARQLEKSHIEGWLVGAYSNDRTGQFRHCAASVQYKSGTLLLFAIGKDFTWSMGFANTRWKLTPGAKYTLTYYVDSGPHHTARGRALNKNLVQVPLLNSRTLFDSFRRGYRLYVRAAGQRFGFNLTNSSKVLAATLDCTRRYVARTHTTTNPFVAQAPRRSNDRTSERAEAAVLLANVLSAAGIQGFRILPANKLPAKLRSHDAVWASPDLLGTLRIISTTTAATPERLAALLMAADAQSCKGVFASGRYPVQEGSRTARLMTGCSGTTKPIEIHYTIMPRSKGGFYLFAVFGQKGHGDLARDFGTRLYDAAVKASRPR